jgi:hypothetical protein
MNKNLPTFHDLTRPNPIYLMCIRLCRHNDGMLKNHIFIFRETLNVSTGQNFLDKIFTVTVLSRIQYVYEKVKSKDINGVGAGFLRELRFLLPMYIPSASPQSSSLSPEAGTIGQEWPQCQ